MSKILITGASGYLAHRLLPIASACGEVIGVARRCESVSGTVQAESLDLLLFNDVIRQPVWIDSLWNALCSLACEQADVSGVMNVVGSQVLSRAAFARLMLSHWSIESNDMIVEKSAVGIEGLPMDLRSSCARATDLKMALPGVAQVLSAA